jgi:steroid delta-isomerase-like uncharacterized protein
MSLEQNKDLVRRFVEEMQNQHDLAALDRFFSQDFVDHAGFAHPPTLAGAREFFIMFFAAFPDVHFTIHRQVAECDKVMTHKTCRATHQGPLWGIPATGKSVTFDVIDIFTVANGQLTEHWAVADFLSMMQQLGVVPGP